MLMGHPQYLNHKTIQITDIYDAFGVSFIIVSVNAAVSDLIISKSGYRKIKVKFSKVLTPFWKRSKRLHPYTVATLNLLALLYHY